MDRIRKISFEVLKDHRSNFGTNFDENKAALESLAIIRSKSLKNKISGRITRAVKREIFEEKERVKRETASVAERKTDSKPRTEEE